MGTSRIFGASSWASVMIRTLPLTRYDAVNVAAACGSLLARAFFGTKGNVAATMPPAGHSWQAAGFEAILTFGLVLIILSLANGRSSMALSSP